jgi:hypothetical protein
MGRSFPPWWSDEKAPRFGMGGGLTIATTIPSA